MIAELWEIIDRWRQREPSPDAGTAELILYAFPRRSAST
jgi:hypothetical protein